MDFYIERFKNIETKEFEVEIVTPMFLSGSDTKKAELRVPSIKGALRFWWRAINAHLALDMLKQQESAIFGDAGDKYGKSKIQIKLSKTLDYDGKSKENPVPHKIAKFAFPCFIPGKNFSFEISGNRNSKVFDLLELSSILGGLGKRSRRGFGSFAIKKINGIKYQPVSSTEDILTLLQNITDQKFKIDNGKIIRADNIHADYAFIKSIEIGNIAFKEYGTILEKIGQSSHDNNSDFTGYAKGKERFSSPVYVSIVKFPNGYRPIITTLNTSFKKRNQNQSQDTSIKFKKDILSGGAK